MAQRDVKNRIASVKNIQKITRAMEMVAAARLRRAETRIAALRPYAGAIRRMTRQAAEAAGDVPALPILAEHPEEKRVALLLVTADRGLAGAFNSQIIRAGIRSGDEHEADGREVVYYATGRRGVSSLTFRNRAPEQGFTGFTERPSFANAREIAAALTAAYIDGKVDRVEILYNGYISPMSQEVRRETLLPLQQATILGDDSEEENGGGNGAHALVDYEPEPEEILERLVPDYVEISIFRALLESTASELGARMTAMRSASDNAGDIISDLTLEMNRARQAEITQEIMEVVAGAEALG
ncbi:ATP synthase F1 subunit gamma [Conexibacter stalactiti]|uniref:ATP synthase gamma chain n=1 Tax=Conexibacter stalactiti TaxID=1940611 RepID=A0ABU4HTI7_9ACTN|nr:ATP synthase F1 subunit gamma [Conexibacter stalactiti]MDW5596628.1 ATP synthase F1 subunit gamma [Conexibacter stalactiti]MEC5037270.1 ATP synthase F1 subunit gamma [Conexibacter stalactiti]